MIRLFSLLLFSLHVAIVFAQNTPIITIADSLLAVQLGSTRQLVINQSLAVNPDGAGALLGGIRFDMNESAILKANAGLAARNSDGTRGELDFSKTDSILRIAHQPQFASKRKRL